MSSNPNSTCATHGSIDDLPPHHAPPCNASSSSFKTSSLKLHLASGACATKQELYKTRIATYITNPINPHPSHQHFASAASTAVHRKDMKAYLEDFDMTLAEK